jgi:hypothetical protein
MTWMENLSEKIRHLANHSRKMSRGIAAIELEQSITITEGAPQRTEQPDNQVPELGTDRKIYLPLVVR